VASLLSRIGALLVIATPAVVLWLRRPAAERAVFLRAAGR
jgi:hypothetical protein